MRTKKALTCSPCFDDGKIITSDWLFSFFGFRVNLNQLGGPKTPISWAMVSSDKSDISMVLGSAVTYCSLVGKDPQTGGGVYAHWPETCDAGRAIRLQYIY